MSKFYSPLKDKRVIFTLLPLAKYEEITNFLENFSNSNYCIDLDELFDETELGIRYYSSLKKEGSFYITSNEELEIYGNPLGERLNVNQLDAIASNSYTKDFAGTGKTKGEKIKELVAGLKDKEDDTDLTFANSLVHLELNKDDDELLLLVKKAINEKGVILSDIYNYFGRTRGYNLYYNLLKKNSITFKILKDWADFLDMEVNVTLD